MNLDDVPLELDVFDGTPFGTNGASFGINGVSVLELMTFGTHDT